MHIGKVLEEWHRKIGRVEAPAVIVVIVMIIQSDHNDVDSGR